MRWRERGDMRWRERGGHEMEREERRGGERGKT